MIYKIINENKIAKDTKDTESFLSVFYEHMLKWKYWTSAQCSSWTNSIFRSIYDISITTENKNVYNRSNKSIDKSYNTGVNVASGYSGLNIKKLDNGKLLEEFPDVNSVLDKDSVRNWLMNYSISDRSNQYVDIGYTHDYSKDKMNEFLGGDFYE